MDGDVEPDWREPQYSEIELTSKVKSQGFGPFADAGEVAYGQNVCDGDWGDWGGRKSIAQYRARRPATYVVPSLAAVFLQRTPTSTNRQQVVADNAMLARLSQQGPVATAAAALFRVPPQPPQGLSAEDRALCEATAGADAAFVESCRRVFDAIDADRGGSLSSVELRDALERLSVRAATPEEGASAADADAMATATAAADVAVAAADADGDGDVDFKEFVKIVLSNGVGVGGGGSGWWARFLRVLRGGDASDADDDQELVRLESEEDVEKLIARFTPAFLAALDALFDRLATAPGTSESATAPDLEEICLGDAICIEEIGTEADADLIREMQASSGEMVISESSALTWLELVNRELGRGGTYRSVLTAFEQSYSVSGRFELTRQP